jgi:hypothetical protein
LSYTVQVIEINQKCKTPCSLSVRPGPRQLQVITPSGASVFRVVDIPETGGIVEVGNVDMSAASTAFMVVAVVTEIGALGMVLPGLILMNPSDDDKKNNSPETLASWNRTGQSLLIGAAISAGVCLGSIVTSLLLPRDLGAAVRGGAPKVGFLPMPNGWQGGLLLTF